MAASRSAAIGTEDERVHREAPEEHRVSRSWMGDALTLLPLCAALQIEDGVHSRRLSHCRRAYSISMWQPHVSGICALRGVANVSGPYRQCLSRRV